MIIISLSGLKGSGKDYVKDLLKSVLQSDYKIKNINCYSFATKLKEIVVDLLDVNLAHVQGNDEDKNKPSNFKWGDFPKWAWLNENQDINKFITVREMLQVVGTTVFRSLNYECWVNYLKKQIINSKCDVAIISDTRFVNEIEMLKSLGAKCWVIRGNRVKSTDKHISETMLNDYKFDYIIENNIGTTNEELISQIKKGLEFK